MLKRLAATLVLTTLLTAAAPPPAALAPYIKTSRLDPGDYGWLRGRFADASPEQKAQWQAIWSWRNACRDEQFAQIRAALARRGVAAKGIEESNGTGVCGDLGYALPQGDQGKSWPAFQAALARARPIAQAVVWSAALAQATADPDQPALAVLLIARPMTDQVLRGSASWDKGDIAGAPPLDPAAQGVAMGLIWLAIGQRDHANTAWLKATVAARGWPTIGSVGKEAAHNAWLLVQHADDDPVVQLDMLRLMEPLAARGEVAPRDYAYLYDRVMLKLAGTQRYGSQVTCTGGHWTPSPLENPAKVEALRRAAGLEPLADNLARIERRYGACGD